MIARQEPWLRSNPTYSDIRVRILAKSTIQTQKTPAAFPNYRGEEVHASIYFPVFAGSPILLIDIVFASVTWYFKPAALQMLSRANFKLVWLKNASSL